MFELEAMVQFARQKLCNYSFVIIYDVVQGSKHLFNIVSLSRTYMKKFASKRSFVPSRTKYSSVLIGKSSVAVGIVSGVILGNFVKLNVRGFIKLIMSSLDLECTEKFV